MNQKGIGLFYIITLVIVVAGLALIYFKIRIDRVQKVETLYTPVIDQTIVTPPPNAALKFKSWETLSNEALGISIKYPSNWHLAGGVLSQANLPRVLQDNGNYNIISMNKNTAQLYTGYYNQDIFERINQLKAGEPLIREYFNPENKKIYKIYSGKTLEGLKFVMIKPDIGEGAKRDIQALVNKDNDLYILSLSYYDNFGLETFKSIVLTASQIKNE